MNTETPPSSLNFTGRSPRLPLSRYRMTARGFLISAPHTRTDRDSCGSDCDSLYER